MNDDLTLLASTYLDGAATPDERAQVEASEELLAEVERLRQVRALVADHEPAPISMRERHLAAALDAWDRLPDAERTGALRDATPSGVDPIAAAAAAHVSAPTPRGARRSRRSPVRNTGWLMAAAAGLVVVLGAGLVVRSVVNDTDDGGADTFDASTADAPAEESASTEAPDAGGAAVDEDAQEFEARTPEEVIAGAPAEAPAADAAELDTSPDAALDAPAPEDDLEALSTLEELGIFASDFLAAEAPAEAADAPAAEPSDGADTEFAAEFPLCGTDVLVGPALYRGEPVLVGIDFEQATAIAYRAEDCTPVAEALLP